MTPVYICNETRDVVFIRKLSGEPVAAMAYGGGGGWVFGYSVNRLYKYPDHPADSWGYRKNVFDKKEILDILIGSLESNGFKLITGKQRVML
jgi:hypothetical protein